MRMAFRRQAQYCAYGRHRETLKFESVHQGAVDDQYGVNHPQLLLTKLTWRSSRTKAA